jgi:catechol 2,3-dioxygenase-like lactoylglutathione lyase family enzyme
MATKKKPARKARTAKTAKKRPKRKQPETLRMRAATPSFTVDDVDRSQRWYRDVLGFVVSDRWEEGGKLLGVEMVAGEVSFYLTQDDWKKGRDRVKGEGFRIYCTTAQDVDGLAKLVKARGGTLEREPRDEIGTRNFAVVDPDGYKITIGSVGKK